MDPISFTLAQLCFLIYACVAGGLIVGVVLIAIMSVNRNDDFDDSEAGVQISQIDRQAELTGPELAQKIRLMVMDGVAINRLSIDILNDVITQCEDALRS